MATQKFKYAIFFKIQDDVGANMQN